MGTVLGLYPAVVDRFLNAKKMRLEAMRRRSSDPKAASEYAAGAVRTMKSALELAREIGDQLESGQAPRQKEIES